MRGFTFNTDFGGRASRPSVSGPPPPVTLSPPTSLSGSDFGDGSGQVSWGPPATGAPPGGYLVTINASTVEYHYDTSIMLLGAGSYNVDVVCLGDGVNFLDSSAANVNFNINPYMGGAF